MRRQPRRIPLVWHRRPTRVFELASQSGPRKVGFRADEAVARLTGRPTSHTDCTPPCGPDGGTRSTGKGCLVRWAHLEILRRPTPHFSAPPVSTIHLGAASGERNLDAAQPHTIFHCLPATIPAQAGHRSRSHRTFPKSRQMCVARGETSFWAESRKSQIAARTQVARIRVGDFERNADRALTTRRATISPLRKSRLIVSTASRQQPGLTEIAGTRPSRK